MRSGGLALPRPITTQTRDGAVVHVLVHDQSHAREMRHWGTVIVDADRRGRSYLLRVANRLAAWLLREWRWYQEIQLLPPQPRRFLRWVRHTYGLIGKSIPIPIREPRTGMLLPRRPGTSARARVMVVDYAR